MTTLSRDSRVGVCLFDFVGLSMIGAGVLSGFRHGWPAWPSTLFLVTMGLMVVVIGTGRIFRPGVTRQLDSVTCRFVPSFEGRPYGALIVVPVFGVCVLGLAPPSDFGTLVRCLGLLMIASAPVSLFYFLRERRRCFLIITPAALTVSHPGHGYRSTVIPRGSVTSVTHRVGRLADGSEAPLTVIDYTGEASGGPNPERVQIGQSNTRKAVWLTVYPANVLAALCIWKDAKSDDLGLMDRVEAALRGRLETPADPL